MLGVNSHGRGRYKAGTSYLEINNIGDALAVIADGLESGKIRLRDFYRGSWGIVNPGKPYVENWATDLLAEHLEAVHLGQIKRLCINYPPRMGKSFHVTIAYPCWEWTEDPRIRTVFSSYSQKLCTRHNLNRRAIITSDWYQGRWGNFVQISSDHNLKTEFTNTALGHMMTAPVGGSATGSGGDKIIGDDLLNPMQALSRAKREHANSFYDDSLYNRLDDPNTGAIVLVEQRTGVKDPTGHIVNDEEGWVKVAIPIEAKSERTYIFPISGEKKVFKAGELLEPRRFNKESIAGLRKRYHDHGAAQLDQDPQLLGGNFFKREDWKEIDDIPNHTLSAWSWDTAVKKDETSDWSVGARGVKWEKGFLITEVFRERLRFPGLKKATKNTYEISPTDVILVEDKSSGQQLIQEFCDETDLPVVGVDSKWTSLDKTTRAMLMLRQWTSGKVWVLKDGPGIACMIEEFAAFGPGCDFDDQVDAVVNLIQYLKNADLGGNVEDSEEEGFDFEEGL